MSKPSKRRERELQRHLRLLDQGTTEHYEDTELYDYEYAERTDDVRWYRKFVRAHLDEEQPMLELGAGTGRITAVLGRDGHRVTALDLMPSMLEALRRRIAGRAWRDNITPVQGDMRELGLADASMSLVIAPFNALMHLYTWSDLLACFAEVRRVLQPGGHFAFDVQLPDLDWLTWDPEQRHSVTRFVHPTTGERLVYSTNHFYDPNTQICHIRIFYDEAPQRGRKFRPPAKPKKLVHLAHRQIFPEELRGLLERAGLELVEIKGDFHGAELSPGCDSQLVVCRRS